MAIRIEPEQLECQFIFFYDLRARIIKIETPQNIYSNTFEWRKVNDSELSKFYFNDDFPSKLISAHLHGSFRSFNSDNTDRNPQIKITVENEEQLFTLSENPIGIDIPVQSFSFIECTLFKNGILALTLRLKNCNVIEDAKHYVQAIARPEYVRNITDQPAGTYRVGPLVDEIWKNHLDDLEKKLANCLSSLDITAVTIDGGSKKQLKILEEIGDPKQPQQVVDNPNAPTLMQGQTVDTKKIIFHRLRRSRPYVGTVINFPDPIHNDDDTEDEIKERENEIKRLSIACARMTPEFLERFDGLDDYLNEGTPRRNVYYPGPSIIFIGRRGWSCLKLEKRDPLAFQMGVVQTVLFNVQVIFSSVRATRRFVTEIIEKGEEYGIALHTGIADKVDENLIQEIKADAPFPGLTPDKIHAFTAFLAKARLNAPYEDLSTLLTAHLMSHTGIDALKRITQLVDHDNLIENARNTMSNYSASLEGANQYWNALNAKALIDNATWTRRSIVIVVITFIISILIRIFFNR